MSGRQRSRRSRSRSQLRLLLRLRLRLLLLLRTYLLPPPAERLGLPDRSRCRSPDLPRARSRSLDLSRSRQRSRSRDLSRRGCCCSGLCCLSALVMLLVVFKPSAPVPSAAAPAAALGGRPDMPGSSPWLALACSCWSAAAPVCPKGLSGGRSDASEVRCSRLGGRSTGAAAASLGGCGCATAALCASMLPGCCTAVGLASLLLRTWGGFMSTLLRAVRSLPSPLPLRVREARTSSMLQGCAALSSTPLLLPLGCDGLASLTPWGVWPSLRPAPAATTACCCATAVSTAGCGRSLLGWRACWMLVLIVLAAGAGAGELPAAAAASGAASGGGPVAAACLSLG